MVFDEEFVNNLPKLKKYGNPRVVLLCRWPTSQNLREQVEKWFKNIPEEHQADIKARLRSSDDGEHMGAFYELVLHQFCLEEEWKPQIHANTDDGKTPDITIEPSDSEKVLIEVYSQQDTKEQIQTNGIIDSLCERINEIKTKYYLSAHFKSEPEAIFNEDLVISQIEQWLSGLDGKKKKEMEKLEIITDGLELEIEARIEDFKLTNNSVLYSIFYPTRSGLPGLDKVKNKLQVKRKKYSTAKTKLPLVIAVGNATSSYIDGPRTIDRALYGWPTVTFSTVGNEEQSKFGRDNSGLVTPVLSDDGYLARNKGISAVLYISQIYNADEERTEYEMRVFHNPWAYEKLEADIFKKVPQLRVIQDDDAAVKLEWDMEDYERQRVYFE